MKTDIVELYKAGDQARNQTGLKYPTNLIEEMLICTLNY